MTNYKNMPLIWALLMLFCIVTSMSTERAWSLELSVNENNNGMTSVSQIMSNKLEDHSINSSAQSGQMGVYDIKTLNANTYKPLPIMEQQVALFSSPAPQNVVKRSIPTFVIFPVMLHSTKEKAFSDLPIMLSASVANQLSDKLAKSGLNVSVINPIYAYDDLKDKGLDGLYQKLVRDFLEAGQPYEKDLTYLADQLSSGNSHVDWIAFVQADFDTQHVTRPAGFEIPKAWLLNSPAKEPNYFIQGWMQIYSTQDGTPLLWNGTASSRLRMSDFGNFTKSVFDDSHSAYNFKMATSKLAQTMISSIPQQTYNAFSIVHAELAPPSNTENPATLTPEDQKTLKRLLNH